MDKAHGGPMKPLLVMRMRQRPRCRCSYSPRCANLEDAEDTKSEGFLPAGHVDKGETSMAIPFVVMSVGDAGIECVTHPGGGSGRRNWLIPKGNQDLETWTTW